MPDAPLPIQVLASILGVDAGAISSREELEPWCKFGRRVERVAWVADGGEVEACVKYGDHLDREALTYASLVDPEIDPVLCLVAWHPLDGGGHLVATRWLPGRTPSFQDAGDVLPVFTAAGSYAGIWGARVRGVADGKDLVRRPVPPPLEAAWRRLMEARDRDWYRNRLARDAASVLDRRQQLLDFGGVGLAAVRACERVAELSPRLAESICSVPQTLDPGDFADENSRIATDGTVRIIDFDNVRLVPVVTMLESVGEDWPSQPAPGLVEDALQAFVQGWNDAAPAMRLNWRTFRAAHHSLRVWRKCHELEYSLRDLLSPREDSAYEEDAAEFAAGCARDLPVLLETALSLV